MIRNIKSVTNIVQLGTKIKFPNRFKGTIIEKWADYWKNLFIDYRQAIQELRTDIQDNPNKAFKWTAGLITVYALAANNPSELDFKDNLKTLANEVVLVSEDCRNPKSIEHLRFLDMGYNQGVLHYRNLGIASVMYTTELNDSCDLYKINCEYMKPSYLSFPTKIVDVGFMGKWWNIHIKTTNYDVNPML